MLTDKWRITRLWEAGYELQAGFMTEALLFNKWTPEWWRIQLGRWEHAAGIRPMQETN